jgi:hypothetical protein
MGLIASLMHIMIPFQSIWYRESIYNSYIEKNDLAEDIKTRKKEFIEKADSPLRNGLYNSPLYCGFKHKTTMEEVAAIRDRQQCIDLPEDSDESKIDSPVSLLSR